MSGSIDHPVDQIIASVLINNALGTLPEDDGEWPIFYNREPDKQDNQITVIQRDGITGPRVGPYPNAERHVHHGCQVLVRGYPRLTAHRKSQAIAIFFDETLLNEALTIDSSSYTIYTVTRVGDLLDLGVEPEHSKRQIYSLNLIVALRQL